MNVLGIIAFGENPAAALLRDGRLVAFAEEERFSRLKGSDGMFPTGAAAYCLAEAELDLGGVDRIAFGWDCTKYPFRMARSFGSNYVRHRRRQRKAAHVEKGSSSVSSAVEALFEYHPARVSALVRQGLRDAGLTGQVPPIEYIPHHEAHAYSTYFCSNFERAGVLTMDGSGEDVCSQLWIGEGDELRLVQSMPLPHSLGWFFAAITQYVGMIPYRDEGKLMGLAALGEERREQNKWIEPLSKVLRIENGGYEVDPIYTKLGGHYYADRFTDALVDLLTSTDQDLTPVHYGEKTRAGEQVAPRYLLESYVDLAWAAQELLEQAAVGLARRLVAEHGVEDLCIAGGVGMNCKMNGEILRRSGCKNLFVQPASSDGGAALGAAMAVAQRLGDPIREPLEHVFWGPGFTSEEIQASIENCKLSYKTLSDPAETGARLLDEGKIIAWFQGRMEFGARALGHRSILANPVLPEIKNRVNREVKYRESWRPFCPSMTDESKHDYLVDPNDASYMIVAYPIQEAMRGQVPSAVHVDGTVRPQTVKAEVEPLYHALLSNLGKRTGHPVVLNTSLNVRGEPIICTPLEAIRCFYSNGLDALVLGNFLLEKH